MFRSIQFRGGWGRRKRSPQVEAVGPRRGRRACGGVLVAAFAAAMVAAVVVPVGPAGAAEGSLRSFEPDYRMSKQYVAVTAYKILRDHAPGTVAGCASDVKSEPDRFDDLGGAGAFTRGSINCLDKLGYLEGNLPGGSEDGDERLFEPDYRMSKQYVAVTAYKILRDHAPGTVVGCASDVKSEPDRFDDLGGAGAFTRGSINCLDKLGYLEGNLPGGASAPCPADMAEADWLPADWRTSDWWKQATLVMVLHGLHCGADVSASGDDNGNTPLHFAAAFAHDGAVVQALVDAGADVDAKNNDGYIPLHLANGVGNTTAIAVLTEAKGSEPESSEFTDLAVGSWHACGLRIDQTVFCWGNPLVAGLPDGVSTRVVFGLLDAPSGKFTAVTAGNLFTCGLGVNGTVACWGDNDGGESDAPSGRFTAIDAGYDHSCGLRTDGSVVCWGANDEGKADAPSGRFTAVSAGESHSCGLRADGTVACWGANRVVRWTATGQWDTVFAASEFTVVTRVRGDYQIGGAQHWFVSALLDEIEAHTFDMGWGFVCGLRADGSISCAGSNDQGQTDAPTGEFKQLSLQGSSAACALRTDGTVACWGNDRFLVVSEAPSAS